MSERRRVLVIGAGIAGRSVAHELTRTAAARARWDVELVEMGHRVGGRLASPHRPEAWGRNEEHGLHVWFGWYDNTFAWPRRSGETGNARSLAYLLEAGADAVRLDAAQTGLDNLALAGAWVRTPVNSTSVQAAVSSGLAAARALGAEAWPIFAEHLYRRPSRHVWLPGRAPHSSNDAHASSYSEPDLEPNPTIERGARVAPPSALRAARDGRRRRAARTPA